MERGRGSGICFFCRGGGDRRFVQREVVIGLLWEGKG